jgi:NADPH-dependent glutamate synthase beta subunit-like oxidoreductase/NAD-dependent dihydropyrimidine dehydrogenase PreA subunit
MRAPKDRLHRVLVVGATPAGLAAANKLGEMGISVTLVDPDPDLNHKLSRDEWRLQSGVALNYALRPGLLRILRNPRIRCLVPGEVLAIKHSPQGFSARLKTLPTYVDADRCSLCGRCVAVCPVEIEAEPRAIRFGGRQSLPGRPVIDKRRQPLCQANCPLGVNVQGYMALARQGRYPEALEVVRRDNVLPGICGRVCTHPCEAACRRGGLDASLAIKDVKRFLADHARTHHAADGEGDGDVAWPATAPSVGVVGSGPAGLAAAADLARFGYRVIVYEREAQPGGMLRYGIGPFRLPRAVLDQELADIRRLGVHFETSAAVDLAADLPTLLHDHAALIVATGCWVDRTLGVPGEDLEGVEGCLEFLGHLYRNDPPRIGGTVAVVGDGNAAFDAARALVRLGVDTTIVSWFPEGLIPADAEEVRAALEEGVKLVDRLQVTAFLGDNGRLTHLRCAPTVPGPADSQGIPWPVLEPGGVAVELPFDRTIVAIGQKGEARRYATENGLHATSRGLIAVDDSGRTHIPRVYAAGDARSGPSSVVVAMASGRHVAHAVHRHLSGREVAPFKRERVSVRDFDAIAPDLPALARASMPERQVTVRTQGFVEVALGLNEAQTLAEAARCLQCGGCSECLECLAACGERSAIRHDELPHTAVEQVGVVILADPEIAPAINGEDVIRAYGPKAAKIDVYAMMFRGFAAAAEALTLIEGSAPRLKGHGLSFAPPDPQLPAEIRVGVFACRCNDAFGWSEDLRRCLMELAQRADVEVAQEVPAACTPEGTAALLRTIRERSLTRVVLASCVCCPLDFNCSACTDQRSRLKDGLFNATGVSRAMVETCNLRGEALRFLPEDAALARERFSGLIERSISRARKLRTMPPPARPYNFTTAVIGTSEAAQKSALTLAQLGMEVFLFGTVGTPLAGSLKHPQIHCFAGSAVKALRGTIGNFQVVAETGGTEQVLQVGAVILGERSRRRIPYVPMAELPPHMVEYSMQQRGVPGIPFFLPGATSIPGLFLANPPGVQVSERIKGAAAAILAAAAMPRRPRQNKGYTVTVAENLCRGCGRCIQTCPYQAVSFRQNALGGWSAFVDEALCKGCGNCIAVCPTNAADSPYRDQRYLEQMIEEILS